MIKNRSFSLVNSTQNSWIVSLSIIPTYSFFEFINVCTIISIPDKIILDQMRTGLASSLEGIAEEPTIGTFKVVCAPDRF